jgi:hypothetical protein
MRIGNAPLQLDSSDMSGSIISQPIWLGHIANYSIQLVFSGTPAGAFKLQCSNDEGDPNADKHVPPRDYKVTNYTDILGSEQTVTEAGDLTYDTANIGYRWVRLVWTPTSGSGTLDGARFNVKGV